MPARDSARADGTDSDPITWGRASEDGIRHDGRKSITDDGRSDCCFDTSVDEFPAREFRPALLFCRSCWGLLGQFRLLGKSSWDSQAGRAAVRPLRLRPGRTGVITFSGTAISSS